MKFYKKNHAKNKLTKLNGSKKMIVVSLIMVFCIILIGISFSYAFWTRSKSQTDVNNVDSGCLNFTLNDLDVNGNTTSINLDNSYPINDIKGQLLSPYIMTISNTCTIDANTFIYLHSLSTSSIESKYIKFKLKDNSNIDVGPSLVSDFLLESDNNINDALSDKISNIKESFKLTNFDLKPGESITLELQLWLDIDAPNSVMGNMYESAVSVFATTNE